MLILSVQVPLDCHVIYVG